MSGLVVVLLLLAGVVLSVPGCGVARSRPGGAPRASPGAAVLATRATVRAWWRRRRRHDRAEVGRVLVEVASRLRAGADLGTAWRRSLGERPPAWWRPVLEAVGDARLERSTGLPARRRKRTSPRPDVLAAASACRLARRTGAPLAEVVDVVVAGIDEAQEADELRRTALAGPRATARLLAWLPVGGVVLGMLLGADPLGVLLGGGVGGACLVLGAALLVLGRRWVRLLVRDAERAGV